MKAARGKEKFSGRIDSLRGPGGKRKRTWGGLEVEEFKLESATLPALEARLAAINQQFSGGRTSYHCLTAAPVVPTTPAGSLQTVTIKNETQRRGEITGGGK
ncbi:MAG TPA: hypothetical protein VK742_20340 [Candidatus Sulfotelmatobacter sp.]|jgi:hypothetical protein|nr:hypothetical protein [Candidatus Sulfotelmatobacter sp.]